MDINLVGKRKRKISSGHNRNSDVVFVPLHLRYLAHIQEKQHDFVTVVAGLYVSEEEEETFALSLRMSNENKKSTGRPKTVASPIGNP